MALFAPLIAFIGRQVGRIVQMAFGWATLLLFGRVPQRKQLLLAGVALGSVLWVVLLIGVAMPDIGTWLLAFVPAPSFVDDDVVRLLMLGLAVLLPLLVGLGGLFLMDDDDRPRGFGGTCVQVLRGYPYAAVLSLVIAMLLLVAPIFKVRAIVKRWEDAHIPIMVKPNGYDRVATDLEAAVDAAGLDLTRGRAPRILEMPSRLLASVGGAAVRRLVPDQIVMLKAKTLEVTIHPSDVAMVGSKQAVAWARAAIADKLAKTEAYLTTSEEAQQVEDALGKLRDPGPVDPDVAHGWLVAIDKRLAELTVPYEEWEVLYRQRLQIERDLLRAHQDGSGDGAQAGEDGDGLVDRVRRAIGNLAGLMALASISARLLQDMRLSEHFGLTECASARDET